MTTLEAEVELEWIVATEDEVGFEASRGWRDQQDEELQSRESRALHRQE